jgi:Tol biopolymer transport system component
MKFSLSVIKMSYLIFFFCFLFMFVSSTMAEYIAPGVRLTRLTDDGRSVAAAWAYKGDQVAYLFFETGTQKQLMVMNSDGTNKQAITEIGNPYFVEWSWDSTKLSYEFSNTADSQSQSQVYIYDLNSQRTTTVSAPYTRAALDENDGPFWSANDRYVAYLVRFGPARTRQLWVAEVTSGKKWRLLPERGQAEDHAWALSSPNKLCLLIESGGGGFPGYPGFDVANVDADGRNLNLLTDMGPQSVWTADPSFSPDGQWVAYTSSIDMPQNERDLRREDCFIVRPDGSESINLTNATSPATEKQLNIDAIFWSWDSRWILAYGDRFDNQGNSIDTGYLIDPVNGGYQPIISSYPEKDGIYNNLRSVKWSYDSTKIVMLMSRMTVRNWPATPQYESPHSVISIYDMKTGIWEDILDYDENQDRLNILGSAGRGDIADISFSPDNRSILLTVAQIISADDKSYQPDVYRLDLPDRLISSKAATYIGPSVERAFAGSPTALAKLQPEITPPTVEEEPAEQVVEVTSDASEKVGIDGYITTTIEPQHMTVDEATASLSAEYNPYFTVNPSRNTILFKGPPDIYEAFKRDLSLIDTKPPQILVDFLAIELSDEANRVLGLDWTYVEGHFGFFQPDSSPVQVFPHVGPDLDLRVGAPSGALDELRTIPGVGTSLYQGVGTLPREFYIRLNTLIEDGKGTILANPRTVAMSGKESVIQIRKTLNYFFNEGFDVAGRPVVKKSDITADTVGRITPTLLPDGQINLKADVKVGNFRFTQAAGLPELTTRQSTTEINVQQGQTLVIGGLRQQEMSNKVRKMPLLGDLPLLGPLFRKEERYITHSVLTILITPQLMQQDNPIPDWPTIDSNDFTIVPIMEDGYLDKKE